jgi:Protein of unknown function (DUF4240)
MTQEQFWAIVEQARKLAGEDQDARVDHLNTLLDKLSLTDIADFDQHYNALILRANRWDLWGAAYLMNGGCSDDGFRYFCHWLISEGKDRFDAALLNPDSLADVPQQDYFELELFAYQALDVYESKGGGELTRDFSIETTGPLGTEWSEEELPSLFPRLAGKYLDKE